MKRFKADGLFVKFNYTDKARGILAALRSSFPGIRTAWIAGNVVYVLKHDHAEWAELSPDLKTMLKAA